MPHYRGEVDAQSVRPCQGQGERKAELRLGPGCMPHAQTVCIWELHHKCQGGSLSPGQSFRGFLCRFFTFMQWPQRQRLEPFLCRRCFYESWLWGAVVRSLGSNLILPRVWPWDLSVLQLPHLCSGCLNSVGLCNPHCYVQNYPAHSPLDEK